MRATLICFSKQNICSCACRAASLKITQILCVTETSDIHFIWRYTLTTSCNFFRLNTLVRREGISWPTWANVYWDRRRYMASLRPNGWSIGHYMSPFNWFVYMYEYWNGKIVGMTALVVTGDVKSPVTTRAVTQTIIWFLWLIRWDSGTCMLLWAGPSLTKQWDVITHIRLTPTAI